MLKDIFGTYNMRSRINVGLIFLAPILLQFYLLIPEIRTLSSTFIVTLIVYALSSLIIVFSRLRGSRALQKCFPDGLPAQQYLMPEDSNIDKLSKLRYYSFLEHHVPNFKVSKDARKMKKQSEIAVTWLIAQTRNETNFPLIAEENMNLGFSYNLLGLKPFGISLCILLLFLDIIIGYLSHFLKFSVNDINIIYSIIFTMLCLCIWIFVVNKRLVKSCGKKYARALLSACDSPFLNN